MPSSACLYGGRQFSLPWIIFLQPNESVLLLCSGSALIFRLQGVAALGAIWSTAIIIIKAIPDRAAGKISLGSSISCWLHTEGLAERPVLYRYTLLETEKSSCKATEPAPYSPWPWICNLPGDLTYMKKYNLLEASAVCVVLKYDWDATVRSPAHSLQNPLWGNKKPQPNLKVALAQKRISLLL